MFKISSDALTVRSLGVSAGSWGEQSCRVTSVHSSQTTGAKYSTKPGVLKGCWRRGRACGRAAETTEGWERCHGGGCKGPSAWVVPGLTRHLAVAGKCSQRGSSGVEGRFSAAELSRTIPGGNKTRVLKVRLTIRRGDQNGGLKTFSPYLCLKANFLARCFLGR